MSAVSLLLTLASSAQLTDYPFQPATYRSADERFELLVDPTDRKGLGAGRYRMTRDGEPLWECKLPFTLTKAMVSNDGVTVGFGYPDGIAAVGDLVVAILAADGSPRWQEALSRKAQLGRLHRYAHPIARGLTLDQAHDRFLLRLSDADPRASAELWREYRLSTGGLTKELDLHTTMRDPKFAQHSTSSEPIPQTPLLLTHWDSNAGYGARFTLSDLEGNVVWQLDRPRDYEVDGEEEQLSRHRWELALDGGALLARGPGPTFDLWFARDEARVSFEVAETSRTWHVTETKREPWSPPPASPPKKMPLPPVITLEPRGTDHFTGSNGEPVTLAHVTIDSQGRSYLHHGRDSKILVFSATGTRERELALTWPMVWIDWLSVGEDGILFVGDRSGRGASFDRDDTYVQIPRFSEADWVPGTSTRWVFGSIGFLGRAAVLLDDDRELLRLEHDAEGRWLEEAKWLTVSSNGRLLIAQALRFDSIRLNLYDGDAKPLRVIDLPDEVELLPGSTAWHGNTIAAASASDLYLYDVEGKPLGRMPFGSIKLLALFFSPDGRELWLYAGNSRHRFALP